MLKAFIKLALFVIVPVVVLIYVEPFNPVHKIRLYLSKQFFVDTFQGTFYLLNSQLEKHPQQQWPAEFRRIANHFGYSTELLTINDAGEKSGQLDQLQQGEFVYVDQEPAILMRKVDRSQWVISMTMGPEEDEKTKRLASGTFFLIDQYFQQIPEQQWPAALKQLKEEFILELALSELSDLKLKKAQLDELSGKQFTWSDGPDGEMYYHRVGDSNQVLIAGPLSIDGINTTMIFSVIGILFTAISIGLLCWLRPLWRDIKKLDTSALAFGNGDLTSRVSINSGSIAARLGLSFNRMADNIQQLINTNRQLTNAVAHDLRTPLARLRFAFEILDSENCSEVENIRYRKSIQTSIDSLDYLINQTLLHSRYTRVPNISKFGHHNLVASLNDEVEEYALNHDEIEFVFSADNELHRTRQWADIRAINRALSNLLSNASRYADKTVAVSLSIQNDDLNLVVEDDGPGISEEDYEIVFAPFAQIGNEQRDANCGHGLGLAIVQQIAKWHSGSVTVERSKLGGAQFKLSWPARFC